MPFQEILPGVHLLSLWQENVYLLDAGGEATIIDTGIQFERKTLVDALTLQLGDLRRLKTILQTHAHCDHAGNSVYLSQLTGAQIWINQLEAPFLNSKKTYIPSGLQAISIRGFCFAMGEIIFPVQRGPVHRLLADGETVESPIGSLRVIHTPGHTIGHTSYYHEERSILFSGDAILNVNPWKRKTELCLPVTIFSTNMKVARQSATKLAEIEPESLLSQHGHPILGQASAQLRAFAAPFNKDTNGYGENQ